MYKSYMDEAGIRRDECVLLDKDAGPVLAHYLENGMRIYIVWVSENGLAGGKLTMKTWRKCGRRLGR